MAVILSSVPYLYFMQGKIIGYLIPAAVIIILFPMGFLNSILPGRKHLPLMIYLTWMPLAFLLSGSASGRFALRTAGYFMGGYVAAIVMAKVLSEKRGLIFLEGFLSLFSFSGIILLLLDVMGVSNRGVMFNMRIPYLGLKPIKSVVFGPNYFSVPVFVAAGLCYFLWREDRNFYHIVLLSLNLLALFLSFSRAGYLALVVFVLVEAGRRKLKFAFMALAIFLALFITFPGFMQMSRGMTGREVIWPLAWQLAQESPVVGWGEEVSEVFRKTNIKWNSAHNSFLDFAIMYGFPGAIFYFFLFLFSFLFATKMKSSLRELLIPLIPSLFALSLFSTFVVGGFSIGSVITGIFLGMGFLN